MGTDTKFIAVKVDEATKKQITDYALKTHRSVSGTVRFALDELWKNESG